jgi:hypothetical protein
VAIQENHPAAREDVDVTVTVVELRAADDSGLPATGVAAPRLSWRLAGDRPGVRQTGYEVQVAAEPEFAGDVESSVSSRRRAPCMSPGRRRRCAAARSAGGGCGPAPTGG